LPPNIFKFARLLVHVPVFYNLFVNIISVSNISIKIDIEMIMIMASNTIVVELTLSAKGY
jgi:hypothetical protein